MGRDRVSAEYEAQHADILRRGKKLDDTFMEVARGITSTIREMQAYKAMHGDWPAGVRAQLLDLRRRGLVTKAAILRLRAELIDLELRRESPFAGEDIPDCWPPTEEL